MGFRFETDEALGDAVRRVMSELTEDSLERIDHAAADTITQAIHEVRKNCKKGRGLVRLVRPAIGDDYHAANRALRDAARLLGPFRDPHALLQTFDDLIASAPDLVPGGGVLGVRRELANRSAHATESILGDERDRLSDARDSIESVGARVTKWNLPNQFDDVCRGIAKTYKRGRKRLGDVIEAPRDAVFHEWRKRVKYLWYQTRLLRDAAPSILRPLASSLHDVSNALGDAHDLAILTDQLEDLGHGLPVREVDAVTVTARGRKTELEDRAIGLGRRLYVEPTKSFVERIDAYLEVWREMPPREAGELADLYPPADDLAEQSFEDLYARAADLGLGARTSIRREELVGSLRAAGV